MKIKYGVLKIPTKTKQQQTSKPKWLKSLRIFGGSTGHGFEKIKNESQSNLN